MRVARRPALLALALLACLALALPALAAAKKPAKRPVITRITPMRVQVGATLTIRGRGFSARRTRNTVVFRASNGRSAFAKPRRASARKLTVRVPPALARILGTKATRIKIRVLAGRFSAFTPRRLSPVVLPSGSGPSGPGGQSSCVAGDYDGDLLDGQTELRLGTDPCLADTDGDGVNDGYEVQSATDLNGYPSTPPVPYPGKRPYPNALDPSDANTDYDGDGMTLREEFIMWTRYSADGVPRIGRPTTLANLLYSDGLQRSRPVPAPTSPPLLAWALYDGGSTFLRDGARDADGDGLGNWDEARGRMTEAWWPATHDGRNAPKESKYPDINFLDNADLPGRDAFADPDIDGDGVPDGADDNDRDGISNQFELRRPADWQSTMGANPWAYTNPFNPCKPFNSARCHAYPPLGYYDGDQEPPIGPDPPPGFPASQPATPAG